MAAFRSGCLDGLRDVHLTNRRLSDGFGEALAAALESGALPALRRLICRNLTH